MALGAKITCGVVVEFVVADDENKLWPNSVSVNFVGEFDEVEVELPLPVEHDGEDEREGVTVRTP